ncbi:MAG: mandelate racemase/muconate lactonizing enzyme family protein [Chloroflexota bacterium]|nr:mandelate racemase/muconate lactonizing enzyme family protein [Chloroflexota bacterium]
MRITDVTTIRLRYQPPIAMADAIHFMPERTAILVQVHTDTGLIGIGESAAYGGALTSIERVVLDDLAPIVIGESPFMVERAWARMAHRTHQRGQKGLLQMALSGIDIALWDVIGQATKTPLYQLLGGYRDRLVAYASAGFYAANKGPEELAEEVREYVARGFRHVKIKVGRNPEVVLNPLENMWAPEYATASLDEDVARVRAARGAIGDGIGLAIDANNAWNPSVALSFMRQVEPMKIAWLEEPVATDDYAGSAQVARQLATPVAGYETESSLGGFRQLIASGAVDIVQPDVIWSGGISETRRIAALAQAYRRPIIPHVFSSGVALVANMHLIASIPNGSLLEFDQNPNPLRDELFIEPITIAADGTVALPDGPGLGVTLNPDTIARYRI